MLDAAPETLVQAPLEAARPRVRPSPPTANHRTVPLKIVDAQMAAALEMLGQGSIVGDKLKAVARLLGKSLNDGDDVAELREAAHLVIDIMETMGARLEGFEQQARVRWDHARAELER